MANLSSTLGIEEPLAQQLLTVNIANTQSLLLHCCTKEGRQRVAKASGIDEKQLLAWVHRLDLFRVKGIGGDYATLLSTLGVETLKDLASKRADALHSKMSEVNKAQQIVRQLPTQRRVEQWVAKARDLSPKVR